MNSLRNIAAIVIALVRRLSAGSMLDSYLLIRAPLIWRTYLAHVLWFAFLISLAGVGLSYWLFEPAPPTKVPTLLEINAVIQLMLFAIAAVLLIWGGTLLRVRLRNGTIARRFATGLLYFFGSYALLSAPAGFAHISAMRVASVVTSNEEFRGRYDTLAGFNFGSCYAAKDLPSQEFLDTIVGLERTARGRWRAVPVLDCREKGPHCPSSSPQCMVLITDTNAQEFFPSGITSFSGFGQLESIGYTNFDFIEPRYSSILSALDYTDGKDSSYDIWTKIWHPARAGGALLIAIVFLIASTVRTQPRSTTTSFNGPSLEWFNFVTWSPAWLHRRDRRYLLNHPNKWAMRSHMMFLSSFVVTAFFGACIFMLYFEQGTRVNFDEDTIPFLLSSMILLGVLSTLMGILYRLRLPVLLSSPTDVRRYILSFYKPFLPILITLMVFVAMVALIKERSIPFTPFGIDINDIYNANGSVFLFLMCYVTGQNFVITLFFSLKYFLKTNAVFKVLLNFLTPTFYFALVTALNSASDGLNIWFSMLLNMIVFATLYCVAVRTGTAVATLLFWIAIFPTTFVAGLSVSIFLDDTLTDRDSVVVMLLLTILIFGPILIIRFFSRPLQDRILADASNPREI